MLDDLDRICDAVGATRQGLIKMILVEGIHRYYRGELAKNQALDAYLEKELKRIEANKKMSAKHRTQAALDP